MKKYTIGEIFRLGLLKNHKGEAYKDKASVSNMLARKGAKYEIVDSAWGKAKVFTEKEIKRIQKD